MASGTSCAHMSQKCQLQGVALKNCSTYGKRVDGGDHKTICGGISVGEEIWSREADSD